MRVGVDLPYFPDPTQIRDFAQGAEALGFDHLSFSEHVAATLDTDFPEGFRYDDPWHESLTTAAFLAALTERIELNPSMLLLTLRPAVLAAKQMAEVDLLSGGRLRVGVSVGWNTRECAALGVDPATRGALVEEQVEVVRRLWTERAVTYEGRLVQLHGVGIHPRPDRAIPIWMGGGNFTTGGFPLARTMARAARLADGFKLMAPTAADPDRTGATVTELRRLVVAAGRDPEAFGVEARVVMGAAPESEWVRVVQRARAAGASHLCLTDRAPTGGVEERLVSLARIVAATREHW